MTAAYCCPLGAQLPDTRGTVWRLHLRFWARSARLVSQNQTLWGRCHRRADLTSAPPAHF